VARRKRKSRSGNAIGQIISLLLAFPALYFAAALAGSLVPVNVSWKEPPQATTVYIADNGIHADIIMPLKAEGLDWTPLLPQHDFAAPISGMQWIAFGAGEQHVYLNTPTWFDITPRTIWSGLTGGPRVVHVEHVPSPYYAAREIRLRTEEYRRLWSSIRAEFALDANGHPQRIAHPGYGCCDAFYRGVGTASMLSTCNSWVADRLRLARVKASLWSPFVSGLVWRYRKRSA
jgi:uncharacterized protein (TIGR02117 family)